MTSSPMEDEIAKLREEVASLKRQLAASTNSSISKEAEVAEEVFFQSLWNESDGAFETGNAPSEVRATSPCQTQSSSAAASGQGAAAPTVTFPPAKLALAEQSAHIVIETVSTAMHFSLPSEATTCSSAATVNETHSASSDDTASATKAAPAAQQSCSSVVSMNNFSTKQRNSSSSAAVTVAAGQGAAVTVAAGQGVAANAATSIAMEPAAVNIVSSDGKFSPISTVPTTAFSADTASATKAAPAAQQSCSSVVSMNNCSKKQRNSSSSAAVTVAAGQGAAVTVAAGQGVAANAATSIAMEPAAVNIVSSDGKFSHISAVPTTAFSALLQHCLRTGCKRFLSSSSTSQVLMFVLAQPLSSDDYFNICNEYEFSDSYVTCVGFQFLCITYILRWVTEFEKISQTATNCIVGLPQVIDSGEKCEAEVILEYYSGSDFGTVPSVAFSRLKTFGKWVSSEVITWYARFLSQKMSITNCRIHSADFCRIMFHGTDAARTKNLLKSMVKSDDGLHRVCFPCHLDSHWTLTAFEPPTQTHSSSRLCFLDSLDLFDESIRERFQDFCSDWKIGKCNKLYLCHLGGGLQKTNTTECGIFCMQNMDAVMYMKPFFKSKDWESSANQRTLEGCKIARKTYASLLRQHCVLFLRHGTPVSLAAPEEVQPARLPVLQSGGDVSSGDDDECKPDFCRSCNVALGKGLCTACFNYQPPVLNYKRAHRPASKRTVDEVCALSALLSQCALTFYSRLSKQQRSRMRQHRVKSSSSSRKSKSKRKKLLLLPLPLPLPLLLPLPQLPRLLVHAKQNAWASANRRLSMGNGNEQKKRKTPISFSVSHCMC
jgi:hypothetical protein